MPLHTDAREPERVTDPTGMGVGVRDSGLALVDSGRPYSASSPLA